MLWTLGRRGNFLRSRREAQAPRAQPAGCWSVASITAPAHVAGRIANVRRDLRARVAAAAAAKAPAGRRCLARACAAARDAGPDSGPPRQPAPGRCPRRAVQNAGRVVSPAGSGSGRRRGPGRRLAWRARRGTRCGRGASAPGGWSTPSQVNSRVPVRRVSSSAALLSTESARSSPSARSSTAQRTLASSSTPRMMSSRTGPESGVAAVGQTTRDEPVEPGRPEQRPRPGRLVGAGRRIVVTGRNRQRPPLVEAVLHARRAESDDHAGAGRGAPGGQRRRRAAPAR